MVTKKTYGWITEVTGYLIRREAFTCDSAIEFSSELTPIGLLAEVVLIEAKYVNK